MKRKAESGKRKAERATRTAASAVGLVFAGCALFSTVLSLGAAEPEAVPAPNKTRVQLTDLFGDEVVARGKGVEVKRSHLEEALTTVRATLAARGQATPEERRPVQEALLLQRIIVTPVLTNRATPADHKNAAEAADKKIKE